MRYKVIAEGLYSNGNPIPVGTELTIVDRVPAGWAKSLKEIRAKKVEPVKEPEPETKKEPEVNTIVTTTTVPEPEKKADKK